MDAAVVLRTLLRLRVSAAWCGGCSALHVAYALVLRSVVASRPRGAVAALSPADRGAVTNTAVAATHAACLFVGAVAFLAPRLDIAAAGPLLIPIADAGMEAPAAFWSAAMLGYLCYDLGYFALFAVAGLGRDMAAHHALGFASWLSLLHADMGGVWILWVHLAEARAAIRCAARAQRPKSGAHATPKTRRSGRDHAPRLTRRARNAAQGSTPFLHACWMMHKLGADSGLAYRFCAGMLLLMFFIFRVVASPLCLASLWTHRALWGDSAARKALYYFELSINVFFVGLNWFWFAALCKRALGSKKASKKAKGLAPHGDKHE